MYIREVKNSAANISLYLQWSLSLIRTFIMRRKKYPVLHPHCLRNKVWWIMPIVTSKNMKGTKYPLPECSLPSTWIQTWNQKSIVCCMHNGWSESHKENQKDYGVQEIEGCILCMWSTVSIPGIPYGFMISAKELSLSIKLGVNP